MNAVKFPDMIGVNKTNIITDKAATYQNLKYLLLSVKKTLLGDPYFGSRIQSLIYEKNNVIIRDLIIDEVYTCINQYMPQLFLERKDIEIKTDVIRGKDRATIFIEIKARNIIDYNFENYTIRLLSSEEL